MSLTEMQWVFGEWHIQHFGPRGDSAAIERKFKEEASEFMSCPSIEEAADTVLVLLAWSHRNGYDLDSAVHSKMRRVMERDQLARDDTKGGILS